MTPCVWFTGKGNPTVEARQATCHSIRGYPLRLRPMGIKGLNQVHQIPSYRFAQNLTPLMGFVNLSGRRLQTSPNLLTKNPLHGISCKDRCFQELSLGRQGPVFHFILLLNKGQVA